MRALEQASSDLVIVNKRPQEPIEKQQTQSLPASRNSGRHSTMGNILTRINQHELRVEGVMIDLDNNHLESGQEKVR